jgi:hypothetical protein
MALEMLGERLTIQQLDGLALVACAAVRGFSVDRVEWQPIVTLAALTTGKDFSILGSVLSVGSRIALGVILASSCFGWESEANGVMTSMLRNDAKANWTLEELGWTLCPAGSVDGRDGWTSLFTEVVDSDRAVLEDDYLRRCYSAAVRKGEDVDQGGAADGPRD